MCTKQWDLGYQALLEQTHLQNMGNRRMHLKLCTLFKIVHGLLYFPNDLVMHHHSRYSPTHSLFFIAHMLAPLLSKSHFFLVQSLYGTIFPLKLYMQTPYIDLNYSQHLCLCRFSTYIIIMYITLLLFHLFVVFLHLLYSLL